jgi:hypothetical protein
MNQLHFQAGPRDMEGEAPMTPCEALGHALAAARGKGRPMRADDVADAAFALVDLRRSGWDVARGLSGLPAESGAAFLCTILAAVTGSKVTPVAQVEAERALGELRNLAFDMHRSAAA